MVSTVFIFCKCLKPEEAGGKVTNLAGEEERYDQSIHGAIISNKLIHEEIVKLIKEKVKLD